MRPIKFRAWAQDQMFGVDGLFLNSIQVDRAVDEDGNIMFYKNYVLMQFTGLHDRSNGSLTEIWEGDIIDANGKVKGNIHESPQVYEEGTDHVIAPMGTATWRESESIAMGRGCNYTQ